MALKAKVKNPTATAIAKIKKAAPGAYKKNRDNEAVSKGAQLPEGIARGVAQFSSYKFGEIEKGENKGAPYLTLTGIVKEPVEFKGMRASRTVYFTPTKATKDYAAKTVADRVAEAQNEMKLIGGDDILEGTTEDDWQTVLDTMEEEGPHFYFHTWKGKDTKKYKARVQTQFDGHAEGYSSDDTDEEEDVEESDEEEDEEEAEDDEEETDDTETDSDDESEEETEEEGEEETDEEESDEEEEEEDWKPSKGEIYKYKPKGQKKAIECEVTAIFANKKTVNLKSLNDDKPYKAVPWDSLQGE